MPFFNELRASIGQLYDQPKLMATAALDEGSKAQTPREALVIFKELERLLIDRCCKSPLWKHLWTVLHAEEESMGQTSPVATPFPLLDLPTPAIEKSFRLLPSTDKASLFQAAASEQAKRIREQAFHHIDSTLFELISDPDVLRLYELVYGEPLLPPDIFQKRGEAERNGKTETVRQINAELAKAYRTLINRKIRLNWEFLPRAVKELFGNMCCLELHRSAESLKLALSAIRAHNLVCVGKALEEDGKKIWKTPFDLSTREGLIKAGEAVAEWLNKEGNNTHALYMGNTGLTCLPPEVTKLRNLRFLYLSYNYLCALPPQFANLCKWKDLDLAHNIFFSVPEEIRHLPNLHHFEICSNTIDSVPLWVAELRKKGVYVGT